MASGRQQMAMDLNFHKTEAGREALRTKTHELSRTARNLLFVIDASRPAREWLQLVRGATDEDLESLALLGLVEPQDDRAPLPAFAPETQPPELPTVPLSYEELYQRLAALAREHFGLMRGYRFALEIERANGRDELEVLAQRFLAQIGEHKGLDLARQLRRELGLS